MSRYLGGWVKTDRKWDSPDKTINPLAGKWAARDLYHWLCRAACYTDSDVEIPGQKIKLKCGQLCTSIPEIVTGNSYSTQQVRTSLLTLQSTGLITCKSTNQGRVITITNYRELYVIENDDQQAGQQANKQANKQTSNRQATGKQQAANTIVTIEHSNKPTIEPYEKGVGFPDDNLGDVPIIPDIEYEPIEPQDIEYHSGEPESPVALKNGSEKAIQLVDDPPKSKSKARVQEQGDIDLAVVWYDYALSVLPHTRPKMDTMVDEIRITRESINFNHEQMAALLSWIMAHDRFWADKCTSPKGMRKRSTNGNRKIDNVLIDFYQVVKKQQKSEQVLHNVMSDNFDPFA